MSTRDGIRRFGSPLSRRGFLGASVAAFGAGALTACGGDTGGVDTGGGGDSDTPALSQWFHQYGEEGVQESLEAWAAAYAAATITVEWTEGDYATKLASRLLAGSGVDLFENNTIDVSAAREGQYADMTELMTSLQGTWSEVSYKPITIDDKFWGIPMITDAQLFFYRPSMLADAGVEVPTTWEELVAAAQTLTSGDVKGLFLGNDGGAGLIAANWPRAAGPGVLSDDNTEVTFLTDGFVEAVEQARELYDSGSLLIGAPTDWWDPTAFNQGLAAITWQGLWALPAMIEALGDDVAALAVPPAGADGATMVGISQWNMQVAGSSANVQAALEAAQAQWVDDTAYQEEFALGFGFHIPPNSEVAAGADALSSGVAADVVSLTDEHGWTAGPYWTTAMATHLSDAVNAILTEGADARSTLEGAAEAAQGELDSLNG